MEIVLHCPKCPTDKTPKLYINPELGVFNCFRCGFHGKISWLYKYPDIISKIEDQVSLAEFSKLQQFRPLDVYNIDVIESLKPYREIKETDPQYLYLMSRGWTEDLINIYRPFISSADDYKDRVIIPIIENDTVVYFTARSILQDTFQKYKNPDTISRKNIIFSSKTPESVLFSKDFIILEGIFDAFKVPSSIALLGKTLSKENEMRLLNMMSDKQNIYICLDYGAEASIDLLCKKVYSWFPSKSIYKINTASYITEKYPTDNPMDLGILAKTHTPLELLSWIKANSVRYEPLSLLDILHSKVAKLQVN